jgi:ATP-dependent helicase/nuclease subunit A
LEKAAFNWGAQDGLSPAEIREVHLWVHGALASDLGRRVAKCPRVFREVSASYFDGEVLKEGVTDLAFEEDGAWVLVDYKTDRDLQSRRFQYENQLNLYSVLLRETTPLKVKGACLFDLRNGESIAVTIH